MDNDTKAWLEQVHNERQRIKFGVAALGCALVLAGCGGGSDDEPDAAATDRTTPPHPLCAERPEVCR